MNNGTIEQTKLFQDFKEYVEGKFESMGNFSMIAEGKRNTLCRIENKIDTTYTRAYIEGLHVIARSLVYDKTKVFISDQERFMIKLELENMLIANEDSKAQFFSDIHYSVRKYNAIISGANIYKNESYMELIKKLGL